MRPAAASRARNSSSRKAWLASRSVSAPGSMDRNSSRRVSRQEGSSPTMGTPRARNGAAAASTRRASARASSTRPGRQERASAAQGARGGLPPVAAISARSRDAIAEAGEHVDRRVQVVRLEVGVEGVGEQRDLARPLSPLFRGEGARVRGSRLRRRLWPPLTPTLSPRRSVGRREDSANTSRRQRGSWRLADRPVRRSVSAGECRESRCERS